MLSFCGFFLLLVGIKYLLVKKLVLLLYIRPHDWYGTSLLLVHVSFWPVYMALAVHPICLSHTWQLSTQDVKHYWWDQTPRTVRFGLIDTFKVCLEHIVYVPFFSLWYPRYPSTTKSVGRPMKGHRQYPCGHRGKKSISLIKPKEVLRLRNDFHLMF